MILSCVNQDGCPDPGHCAGRMECCELQAPNEAGYILNAERKDTNAVASAAPKPDEQR